MRLGSKMSEESRKRISEAGRGRKHSEETKKKMSQAKIRYWRAKGVFEKVSQPCLCGCGKLTSPGRKYIIWHNRNGGRSRTRKVILLKCLHCKKNFVTLNPKRKYCSASCFHSHKQSVETRQKMSESQKSFRNKLTKEERGELYGAKNKGDSNPSKRPDVRLKLSKASSGKNNPMYGRKVVFSNDTKEKIRQSKLGKKNPNWKPKVSRDCPICHQPFEVSPKSHRKYCSKICSDKATSQRMLSLKKRIILSKDAKEKIRLSKLGERNPMKRPDVVAKVSKVLKLRWRTDANFARRMLERQSRKPSSLEGNFNETLVENNLPFEYVGDKRFWIGPCKSGSCRNPDFIHKDHKLKKAILLNGKYWHRNRDAVTTEIEDYRSVGYSVLVLWEGEKEQEMIDKVKIFAME